MGASAPPAITMSARPVRISSNPLAMASEPAMQADEWVCAFLTLGMASVMVVAAWCGCPDVAT